MDLKKYFEEFTFKSHEVLLPSIMIPLEIKRWEMYKRLISKRSYKYLVKDKKELQKYLRGNSFPLSRVYEGNFNRHINLNPTYDINNRLFPKWNQLKLAVNAIGIKEDIITIKTCIKTALNDIIQELKELNIEFLDNQVRTFDKKLKKQRLYMEKNAIINKIILKNYPQPKDVL